MITFLDGTLASALPTQAIVNVGGVGYEIFIPLSSYDKLPAAGQPVQGGFYAGVMFSMESARSELAEAVAKELAEKAKS